jgi:hypothetical protein
MTQEIKIPVSADTRGAEAGAKKIDQAVSGVADSVGDITDAARLAGKAIDDLSKKVDGLGAKSKRAAEAAVGQVRYTAERLKIIQEQLSKEFGADVSPADARTAALNFETMRAKRGLGSRSMRLAGDFSDWLGTSRIGAGTAHARAYRRELVGATMRGTSFAGSGPAEPPRPHDEPSEGGGGFRRGVQRAQSNALSFGKGALALTGIGGVMAMAGSAVDSATEEAVGLDTLKRRAGDLGVSFDKLRQESRGATSGMGLTYVEAARLGQQFAKTAGDLRGADIGGAIRSGTAFSRSFGLDPAEGVQFFGVMRRLKVSGDDQSNRRLALSIAEAIEKGGYTAKADEVLSAVADFASIAARTTFQTPNVGGFASYLTSLMKTGYPGLDPSGAAALLGTADSSLRHGGGMGEAGMNFTHAALSRRTSGLNNPILAMALAGGGLFGTTRGTFGKGTPLGDSLGNTGIGLDDVTNLEKVRGMLRSQYGSGPFGRSLRLEAMKNYFGLQSLQGAAALDMMSPEDLGGAGRLVGAAGLDITKMNETGFAGMASLAGMRDMGGLRKMLGGIRGRADIPDSDKIRLESAVQGGDFGKAQLEFARVLGSHGQESTPGAEVRESIADLKKALTDIGTPLLGAMNVIRDSVVAMANVMAPKVATGRSSISTAIDSGSRASAREAMVQGLAETDKMLGLPRGFSARQIEAESHFRPGARSGKGALGLAQVMPATLARLEQKLGRKLNPDDPNDAVLIHRMLMGENMGKFGNALDAARAYNSGWDKSKWNNPETNAYIARLGGTPLPAGDPNGKHERERGLSINLGLTGEVSLPVNDQAGRTMGTANVRPFVAGTPTGTNQFAPNWLTQ